MFIFDSFSSAYFILQKTDRESNPQFYFFLTLTLKLEVYLKYSGSENCCKFSRAIFVIRAIEQRSEI